MGVCYSTARTLLEHRHWRTQGIRLHSRVVHREVYGIGTAGPSATAVPVARELARVHDPLVAHVGATEVALPQLHLLLLLDVRELTLLLQLRVRYM